CFSRSNPVWIPNVTGAGDDFWEHLKIYPNPTSGVIKMEMDNPVMGEAIISVYSESGARIINTADHKTTNLFETEVDLGGTPAGIYMVTLQLGDYQTSLTILVE
ncbi:MAG: T9SS type A sorting domain-containing protein, partial [Bacteroidota bacterium]